MFVRTYINVLNHPIHLYCSKSKTSSTWSEVTVCFSTYRFKKDSVLPRSCDDEYMIFLALKQRLSEESFVNKQHIRRSVVSKALENEVKINTFYKQVLLDNAWEDISKKYDLEFWELLTDERRNLKLLKKQTVRRRWILLIMQSKIDQKCHQSFTQQFYMR